jgi:hypothetical protein
MFSRERDWRRVVAHHIIEDVVMDGPGGIPSPLALVLQQHWQQLEAMRREMGGLRRATMSLEALNPRRQEHGPDRPVLPFGAREQPDFDRPRPPKYVLDSLLNARELTAGKTPRDRPLPSPDPGF